MVDHKSFKQQREETRNQTHLSSAELIMIMMVSVKFHNIVDGISSPSGFSLEA
jgi:hypothetical protein